MGNRSPYRPPPSNVNPLADPSIVVKVQLFEEGVEELPCHCKHQGRDDQRVEDDDQE